nr:uncharacterized protein LOC104646966 [Solanum lycopersicum]
MEEYEACILGIMLPIDMNIQYLLEQPFHCSHVEAEPDGKPWYCDIKKKLETGTYPKDATSNKKKATRRLASNFFQSGELLYRRTPDLGLLRCVYSVEATRLIEKVHARACGPYMNCLTLVKKILQDASPRSFVAWGMDVIGPIDPLAFNGHRFVLVAIDYFTKWVESSSYKSGTKKVVADFDRNNLICRFGLPDSIITDNGANLNSHFMKEICEQFKITHRNSTAYRPQMNGAIEATNKNIKKILRKIIDNHTGWHEMLPYALLGYRTTVRTSIGAIPYLLVHGTEVVIPVKVEIPSLRIIQEAKLTDVDWVRNRVEYLALIDEQGMTVVYHVQLYQQGMIRAFNKKSEISNI